MYARLSPANRARFDAENRLNFRLLKPSMAPARTATNDPYRNKWERRYAALLELKRLAGEILAWEYEPDTLVAAGGTKYTPDFKVTRLDGSQVYHEVKGYTRSRDAVRMRECAAVSPLLILVVTLKQGAWVVARIYPAGRLWRAGE